jgi:citrate lyase beta subunit
MSRDVHPYALGATLYMPVTHPNALAVALGRKHVGLRSLVLCLEDALSEADVPEGLVRLRGLIEGLRAEERDPVSTPLVFLRPRNIDMAAELGQMPGIEAFDGFVCPKVRPGRVAAWTRTVDGTSLRLMPTLETAEILDPFAVRDLRDELVAEAGRERVLALRVGGNDLLACLGLRRRRGQLLYDGPLGGVLANLVNLMVPAGFRLTAPVYEVLDDVDTLAREVAQDIAWGFVGKTVIHPNQVETIHAALRVTESDLDAAQRILAPGAAAVFKHDGAMCEPATHRAWATSILERARYHGLVARPAPSADGGDAASRPMAGATASAAA